MSQARHSARPGRLADVHKPAIFIEGAVHWQMADGPNAVDVRITANALYLFSDASLPGFLEMFDRNRELLCEIAARKFAAGKHCPTGVTIERDDFAP
jgi:hypothetical protein